MPRTVTTPRQLWAVLFEPLPAAVAASTTFEDLTHARHRCVPSLPSNPAHLSVSVQIGARGRPLEGHVALTLPMKDRPATRGQRCRLAVDRPRWSAANFDGGRRY